MTTALFLLAAAQLGVIAWRLHRVGGAQRRLERERRHARELRARLERRP